MKPRTWNAFLLLLVVASASAAAPPAKPKPKPKPKEPAPAPRPVVLTPDQRLFAAVRKGDLPQVKALLDAGGDADAAEEEGTLLAEAAQRGHFAICKLLLDKGAAIAPAEGVYPLAAAAINGHLEVAKLLLEKGADLHWTNEYDYSILALAAGNDQAALVDFLLDKGAKLETKVILATIEEKAAKGAARLLARRPDLSYRSDEGETFLILAAKGSAPELVDLLLKHGSEVNAKDRVGKTALMHATGPERERVVALLKAAGAKEFEPTLEEAIRQRDTRMVRLLLDRGEDPNARHSDGRTSLFAAVEEGEEAVIKALLDKGANPNARDKTGLTVVRAAMAAGHRQAADQLVEAGAEAPDLALVDSLLLGKASAVRQALEEGADPNSTNESNQPALHVALRITEPEVRMELVRLLLGRGANVNAVDGLGWSALTHAAASGSLDLVKELLDRGADLKKAESDGQTPLVSARGEEVDAIIRLLVERGADLRVKDSYGITVLANLAVASSPETLAFALEKGALPDLNTGDEYGRTPLFRAAQAGNAANVKLLLEKGADPNTVDTSEGYTPLLSAVRGIDEDGDYLETVRLLLKHGAKINQATPAGVTPLQAAQAAGEFEMAELLRKAGGKVPAVEKPKPTALLSQAVQRDDIDTARRLLKSGVSPNIGDEDEYSPLMVAALRGNLPMVRLLLACKARADFVPKSEDGLTSPTPLAQAAEEGHVEIVRLLLKYGANPNSVWLGETPLSESIKHGHYEVFEILIAAGAKPDLEAERSPLSVAAMKEDTRFLKLLIRKGAKVDAPDESGDTPLLFAVRGGNLEGVRALVAAGANPKVVNREGATPLIAAAEIGNLDLIQYLLARGCDVNAKDGRNRTPLSVAQDGGHDEAVELLKRAGAKP